MDISNDATASSQLMEDSDPEDSLKKKTKSIAKGDLLPYGRHEAMANDNREMRSEFQQLQYQLSREVDISSCLRQLFNQQRLTAERLTDELSRLLDERKDQKKIGNPDGEHRVLSFFERTMEVPEGKKSVAVSEGYNKYYPDAPEFHGDHDQWVSWKLHLQSKFRASAMLFPTEQARINYICDHCKSIAFDIIKTRCLDCTYVTAQEVLEDLENVYGEFDACGKAFARLHTPDFNMKKKETFDDFVPKFVATVAPLQMSEELKILHLTRTITPRLRWQTTTGYKRTSFPAYVTQLRKCDFDLRQIDQQSKALRKA